MKPQEISIYAPRNIETEASGPRNRPWRVRCKVTGDDVSTHFARERDAWKYYTKLVEARDEGFRFDPATGEPVHWAGVDVSVASWAHTWFNRRSPHLKPRTRLSYVEGLAEVLPHLVVAKAPGLTFAAMQDLRSEIRAWLADVAKPMPKYLSRHSVALSDLEDSGACNRADSALAFGRDGTMRKARTTNRFRVTIKTALNAAVEDKLIVRNPWPSVKKRAVKERIITEPIDEALLPSLADIAAAVARLDRMRTDRAPDYKVIIWLCALAGLRPGEARALHVEDLELPQEGWGLMHVRRSINVCNAALRGSDPLLDTTKTGRSRRVPIEPRLVRILTDHLDGRADGLVAQGHDGNPMGSTALQKAWVLARGDADWDVYDLRRSCATRWLRATGNVPLAARRLGHSPEVLLSIYAGVISGDDDHANARIQDFEG